MKGGSKDFWFVLTAESLSWFKDEEVSIYIYVDDVYGLYNNTKQNSCYSSVNLTLKIHTLF